jgi:hypothetical protein
MQNDMTSPNHVSHKTAVALRDAGFPQPAPAFGQVWYFGGDRKVVVTKASSGQPAEVHYCDGDTHGVSTLKAWIGAGHLAYAPTPSDLLPLLDASLYFSSKGVFVHLGSGRGYLANIPSSLSLVESMAEIILTKQPALPG